MCSRAQATTNSFFLFLGSPPGFLFTVTVQQGSHSLSLSLSVLSFLVFLSTHDRTVTKAVGRMQQTNRQSSEPTENTVSVDTASHLYAVHAMDG